MAGLAGNGRLAGEFRGGQAPWSARVLRLHDVANRSIEIHAVAAVAVVPEPPPRVVRRVGADLRIGGAVPPRVPGGVFTLVAAPALLHHGLEIGLEQVNLRR